VTEIPKFPKIPNFWDLHDWLHSEMIIYPPFANQILGDSANLENRGSHDLVKMKPTPNPWYSSNNDLKASICPSYLRNKFLYQTTA
jgi:hypothetical protein